jgi:putative ABC transport system permease protein
MLRHLLTLTWKRKSRNLMLSLEILLAFLIVFAIGAFGLHNWQLYRMPLGFKSQDVWSVTLKTDAGKGGADVAFDSFRRGLLALPEVRDVAIASFEPFAHSVWSSEMLAPRGTVVQTDQLEASDAFAGVLQLDVVEGRWFGPVDDGAGAQPVVINRRLAAALFPGQSAVGQHFVEKETGAQRHTVIGVVSDYRAKGELGTPGNFQFQRFITGSTMSAANRIGGTLLLKLAPGTGRAFEGRLHQRLSAIRNDWTYEITPLASMRTSMLKSSLLPLVIMTILGAFMLVMVAFGLFGALWQNTTQRIPEIGLRRALGARAGDIYGQIIAEQLLLSSVAIALGLVLLVQLPLTGALGAALNWPVFFGAAGLSMVVIYLLSLLCSLYPGWRASRLSPTQALHHE